MHSRKPQSNGEKHGSYKITFLLTSDVWNITIDRYMIDL